MEYMNKTKEQKKLKKLLDVFYDESSRDTHLEDRIETLELTVESMLQILTQSLKE